MAGAVAAAVLGVPVVRARPVESVRTIAPARLPPSAPAGASFSRTSTVPVRGGLRVRFFAAGHADSALISTPSGRHILIDAGRGHLSFGDNLAVRRLVPFFRQERIRRLDAFFITHPHFDHIGDPVAVRRNVDFDGIHTNPDGAHYLGWLEPALARAAGRPVFVKSVARGRRMVFGRLALDVLHPPLNGKPPRSARSLWIQNNRSLVIRATFGKVRFLFAGDVGFTGERRILDARIPVVADVLKLGHHGRGSTSVRWLKAVRPKYTVASCGDRWRGRRDHLTKSLFVRLRRHRVRSYRTDYDGDVEFVTNGRSIRVSTYPGLARRLPAPCRFPPVRRPRRPRRLRRPPTLTWGRRR